MATSKTLSEFGSDAYSGPEHPSPPPVASTITTSATVIAAALTDGGGPTDRDDWLNVVGQCQELINRLTAVQDSALAEAARRESDWLEDGTLGETVHGRGRITLDAADLAAPALGASHPQAQRRVELAVRLADGRVPVPAEHPGVPDKSGLRGLHAAMAQGRLDGYRASVVVFELDMAPPDVADAVIAALEPHLCDDASALRQRTRRLLARISPDLLRQRATRARASTGLRRWVAEPGVDTWVGTFPSEDAAAAWAVLDQRAHELVAEGTCSTVEQARGKALTDLVTGNARVDVQVVLTVPAEVLENGRDGHTGPDHSDREEDDRAPSGPGHSDREHADRAPSGPGHSGRQGNDLQHSDLRRGTIDAGALAPGAHDHDHDHDHPRYRAPAAASASWDKPMGEPALPEHRETGNADDDDLVQVQGARPSEPLLVRRGWLREHLSERPRPPGHEDSTELPRARSPQARSSSAPTTRVPCDPSTGARLDAHDGLATAAYRPGAQLISLVKARDGRCRFPGCRVAARFCDLDHVRPWPAGPTSARNLLCLCRRHHRIKQRAGWHVRLAADGTATWIDPAGRTRTTVPMDALLVVVLAPPLPFTPSVEAGAPLDATTAGAQAGAPPDTATGAAQAAAPPDPATAAAQAAAPPDTATAAAQAPVARHGAASGPALRGHEEEASLTSRSSGDLPSTEPSQSLDQWSVLETLFQIGLEHHLAGVHVVESRVRIAVAPPTDGHHRCTSSAALRAAFERRRPAAAVADPPPF